jgi:N-acetylglucosaminyldiphosphoundecaprenol N-acetyl-beta-D-mannosaminyltransferase
MKEKVEFLGLHLDNVTMGEALGRIDDFVKGKRPRKIFAPNAALYIYSACDAGLKQIYEKCDLLLADSMGVYYGSRLLGNPVREAVNAARLMVKLLERSAAKGYRLYFLGAEKEICETAVGNVRRRYPGIEIVGWHDGYFGEAGEDQVVENIVATKPDILFVAMSTPQKERFVEKNLHRMCVPVSLGVGGTFDILAGKYKMAPPWVTRYCLEWLFRLMQEPGRLWKRYLITNATFLLILLRAFIAQRLFLRRT